MLNMDTYPPVLYRHMTYLIFGTQGPVIGGDIKILLCGKID